MHVHVKEKSGRLFIDLSVMEESKTYLRSFCTDTSWRSKCAREMCEAVPDCTRASLVHIHVKEEWKVIIRPVMEKRAKRSHVIMHGHSFFLATCAGGVCDADSDCTRASLVQTRPSFLFFMRSTRKLVVAPPMTVDLSLVVAAVTLAPCCLTSPLFSL